MLTLDFVIRKGQLQHFNLLCWNLGVSVGSTWVMFFKCFIYYPPGSASAPSYKSPVWLAQGNWALAISLPTALILLPGAAFPLQGALPWDGGGWCFLGASPALCSFSDLDTSFVTALLSTTLTAASLHSSKFSEAVKILQKPHNWLTG